MSGASQWKIPKGVLESQVVSSVKDLVLLLLKEEGETEITPILVPGFGVYYVLAEFYIPAENILSCYKEAFLDVNGYISFPSCSICHSTSLRLEVLCPNCSQSDLLRLNLVVHYECGFMSDVEDFIKDSQGLINRCPKCNKPLKKVGIDYGRPGIGFRCQRCGAIFQYPLISLRCDKDHVTTLDKLNLERYPIFGVSSELKKAHPILELIQKIREELEKSLNIKAEVLKIVKGKSGALYLVHMFIHLDDKVVAVEVLSEEGDVTEAMKVVVKAADLGTHFIVLLDEDKMLEFGKVINPEYFTLVPIKERRFEDIKEIILESVHSFAFEK